MRIPIRCWLMVFVVFVCAIASSSTTGAVTSTTGREFWYWWGDPVLSEHADHVSVSQMAGLPNVVAARLPALPADVKIGRAHV